MDYDSLIDILEKHYQKSDSSLYVKVIGEETHSVSYYSISNIVQITSLCKLLEKTELIEGLDFIPTLTHEFTRKYTEFSYIPETVLLSDKSGIWKAAFYKVTGVTYKSDEFGHVTATLITSKYPFMTLTNKDPGDFYGFWKKHKINRFEPDICNVGFSYWTNKALNQNAKFRDFAVDFFFAAAEEDKTYIRCRRPKNQPRSRPGRTTSPSRRYPPSSRRNRHNI